MTADLDAGINQYLRQIRSNCGLEAGQLTVQGLHFTQYRRIFIVF